MSRATLRENNIYTFIKEARGSIRPPSMPDTAPPPFPDDVPTVPLLVIDYALLQAGDEHEIDRLWQAATELGFW